MFFFGGVEHGWFDLGVVFVVVQNVVVSGRIRLVGTALFGVRTGIQRFYTNNRVELEKRARDVFTRVVFTHRRPSLNWSYFKTTKQNIGNK